MSIFQRLVIFLVICTLVFAALVSNGLRQAELKLCQQNICAVNGTLIYDSAVSSAGNMLMTIKVSESTNSYGNTATAGGVLTLVAYRRAVLAAGTGVYATGKIVSDQDGTLFVCDSYTVYTKGRLQIVRERLLQWLRTKLLGTSQPTESDTLGIMLILGMSDETGSVLRGKARDAGCLHVLALSGMHLNIVAGLFTAPFKKNRKKQKLARFVSIPAVSVYMFAVYPRPSLIRAYLMFLLAPLEPSVRLALTFVIHCLVFPTHIINQGFLFGYAALAALTMIQPFMFDSMRTLAHPLFSKTPSAAVCVAVFTAPLQYLIYGLWYPVSIISGPVSGLLVTVLMYLYLSVLVFGRQKILIVLIKWFYTILNAVFEKSGAFSKGGIYSMAVLMLLSFAVFKAPSFLRLIQHRIENRTPAWYNLKAMWQFDYTNVSQINRLLEENGLSMTKKFGQNFLISGQALSKITELAGITSSMKVWEIGPGIGALTSKLLATGADVTCFEIDHGFCRILRELAFSNDENFTLVEGDAMKTWKAVYEQKGCPDVICANLPYNVGSVLIASFIENRMLPQKMVFTLQTEVVKRICSGIGDDQYSGFSILTSIDYKNTEALKLKSSNFWPAPKVDSSVVVMTKRENPQVPEEDAVKFLMTVRALFAQRRKTVKNNLKPIAEASKIDTALAQLGISQTERAENLTVDQILGLSKLI